MRAPAHLSATVGPVTEEVDRVGAWAALLRVHAAVVPKLERELASTGLPLS